MNRTGDIYMNRIALAVKSALGIAMLVPPAFAFAATPRRPMTTRSQEIVVTGIRKSVELSIEAKRDSTELTEVVTAEDIGKMPDKNVADSLARLPGITTSAAGANEGGFDENDRVSMRGTNPSLTQTLINGHSVAAGDWFVLDQVQTVGRSVSYTLLPSEIVSKVVVEKSSSASLVEGGVAGSVDIITRKPLDFAKPFTLEASVGAVYADLPSKTDGQYSALANFKNDANNFGVMLQLFSETRHLRRDGVEILGYDTIAPGQPDRDGAPGPVRRAIPDGNRRGVFHAESASATAAWLDIEFKPTDEVTLDLSAFSSKLTASNYNRNYLMWSTHFVNFRRGSSAGPRLCRAEQHADLGELQPRSRALFMASTTKSRGPMKWQRRISSISTRLGMPPARSLSWARSDIPGATARRPRKMCRKPSPGWAAAPDISSTAWAARPISISATPSTRRRLPAACRSPSAGYSVRRTSTSGTRKSGRRSTAITRSTTAPGRT